LRSAPCSECQGTRIREESQHVLVGDLRISETVSLPVGHLRTRLAGLELEGNRAAIAREPLREIENRLRFLEDVGLGYVSLGRSAGSLSGGESQRIRLASQLGTELTGVTYVLDEPSIGLHPVDTARLLATLKRLRDMGNTVVVVEHDPEIIRAADWVIDFGPGAGRAGGAIVAEATPQELTQRRDSVTADFLSGRRAIDVPRIRRKGEGRLRVNGVKHHNLRGIDVEIPLGALTVVTGVSGAGKSSLVNDVIRPELLRLLHGTNVECGFFEEIVGYETLNKVVSIDQRPIGRTPRSNPATYVKVFEEIRRVLASTREARMYGYGPGRFSFNVAGGRCERCRGVGAIKVEMHFLPDVYVQCEACGGTRFNDATLRVHYKGLHVSEILALTVDEACEFFLNHKKIARILGTLQDVGLGYIRLGQPSNTLSGGEAQRIKLSRELARVHTGQTFYILDEPTTGLHLADVERLLGVLHRLVEAGNTVVVIEHHLDVIKVADHLLDLGPGGGDEGGRLVASGTPEVVAGVIQSQTGGKLKMLFCG
jgi:excinuclease ABC subunit A